MATTVSPILRSELSVEPQQLRKPVVAVQRGVQILRYLGRTRSPAGVHEIARALDIVPSTCLHILRTLVHEGMVVFDHRSKRYRLGPTLLRLARDMVGSNEFLQAVQPLLDRIAREHDVTTGAVWLDGTERVIVVAKSQVPSNLSININVGSRFPSLVSAVGICLAAHEGLPPEQLAQQFQQLQWQNPPAPPQWTDEVARARVNGYAVDPGYYIQGVTVMAAPVYEAENRLSRFLVALGFSQALEGAPSQRLARHLKEAAAELSNIYPTYAA
jgi:DNA-binding IclR family transcriptional regulator